ncbi:MAG TPA: serine/threonine-protein kinase [Kofleriaceae bacterium]|nr:serine/threonine-protein kinase [Kofleriaceae bacterium]
MSSQRHSPHSAPRPGPGAAASSPSDAGEAPTVEASDPPDSFDAILKRVVQPAGEVLEVGAELVGRFKILRVLGTGGMGTVYVARDATLGREVAIKVHHAGGGAQRLRREAVAMARLAHPNVVTVFEVGDLGGRPFVVMECIAGTTLRAHLAAAPRSVREVLALLIAAGEGLAAAHDAGLVHRDIKPENVLVGSDGRARVGDFGLARELDSADAPEDPADGPPSIEDLRTPVTLTGAVMGTPAYMAPEQFAGAPVDARADQFAFCVTAWEALWRQRPFAGASYAELSAAIRGGQRRPPPAAPKVPARIRAALERGLATDPAARFPTLHALLDAMRPLRGRRWRWLAAGGVVAAAAVATALVVHRGAPSCELAGDADLGGLRRDLPALLRQHGTPQIAARVEALAQGYVERFRGQARQACAAERAHQWSPELAARSRQCFAVAGRTAALTLAGVDPARPLDALHRARRLRTEEHCTSPNYLAARPALPGDPAQLAALTEANALLTAGLESIGGHDLAGLRRALAALEASSARGDPGVAAGLPILRGWIALDAGRIADARGQLGDAYFAGRAIDDELISSTALGLLIEYGPDLEASHDQLGDWLRTALADADRVRGRSPWLAGRLYAVAARAADTANDAAAALQFIARAREVLDEHDPVRIETGLTEGAVLMWSGRVDDGIHAYEAAIAQQAAALGGDDPDLASALSDYASSLLDAQHLEQAMRAADRAFQIVAGAVDPDDDRLDPIRMTLAAVLIGANQDDEAFGLLQVAREHTVRRLGESTTLVANIDSNLATIYIGKHEYDRAIIALRSALAIDEKLLGADRLEVAGVLYNLAAAYRSKHDAAQAIAAARRAAAIYAARSPGADRHRLALTLAATAANDARDFAQGAELTAAALGFARPAESAQTPAWAQLERARALIGLGRAGEARPLLDAARAAYADLHMTERVREADDLLAQLPKTGAH